MKSASGNDHALADDAIIEEITINASAERIFEALTNPAELLKWWAAGGKFKATHVESDLRTGGKWLMRVSADRGPDSSSTTVHGEYRKIDPPRQLVFAWIRDEDNSPETLVCWELDEKDGTTKVRVTHSGLISESLRIRNNGWPVIQGLLKAYMEQNA